MMSPYLRFEQISERAKINSTTLRYYMRLGLLPDAERNAKGHKEYPVSVLNRLAGISRAKRLGFTLQEIKSLFSDQGWPDDMAESKLELLNGQINTLTEQRDALAKLTTPVQTDAHALISHIKEGEAWNGTPAND